MPDLLKELIEYPRSRFSAPFLDTRKSIGGEHGGYRQYDQAANPEKKRALHAVSFTSSVPHSATGGAA